MSEKHRSAYATGYARGLQVRPHLPSDETECELVMAEMPGPLSGEFSDDWTPKELLEHLGLDPNDLSLHTGLVTLNDELCDAFEEGYYDALQSEE